MRLILFFAVFALCCEGTASAFSPKDDGPAHCRFIRQSKTPPYTIHIACNPDCRHIPKLPTVHELVAAGVDPEAAPGVVEIQSGYWQRACAMRRPSK